MDVIKNAKELCKAIRRSLGNYPRATKVTLLECEGALMIAVRYHDTDVVRCFLDDTGSKVLSVVLDSGGWATATTRDRMNAVLRFLGAEHSIVHSRKDSLFTVVTRWEEGDDPKGTGAKGLLRTELPFEDQMCLTRKGKRFVIERPTKAEQKKLTKVVFSKFSPAQIETRERNRESLAALDNDPPVCPYCKSDDHASYNCEERHR